MFQNWMLILNTKGSVVEVTNIYMCFPELIIK